MNGIVYKMLTETCIPQEKYDEFMQGLKTFVNEDELDLSVYVDVKIPGRFKINGKDFNSITLRVNTHTWQRHRLDPLVSHIGCTDEEGLFRLVTRRRRETPLFEARDGYFWQVDNKED